MMVVWERGYNPHGYPQYIVLFSRPDMKLIAWLAREAIWLPMVRSFSVIKQPRHLPIHQLQNLLLPFWYWGYQSHCNFTRALHPQNFQIFYGASPSVIMILLKWLEVPGDENLVPNHWNNDDIKLQKRHGKNGHFGHFIIFVCLTKPWWLWIILIVGFF